MVLTGETGVTGEKSCPISTFFTTNLSWIGLVSNPELCGERPATDRLSHGTVLEYQVMSG